MSDDGPDLTAILDNLFIGNLAAAKTLHERPELGITHVLSVCPDYPEAESARQGANAAEDAACPTVWHPAHRCLSVEDSEYEDILSHLPSAIAFIKGALDPPQSFEKHDGQQTQVQGRHSKQESDLGLQEASDAVPRQKHRVLVHCVMGISRSTAVVCAYPLILMPTDEGRPRVHPNYGFRRQLQIFGDCGYFADYHAPIRTHPAYASWQRKKKREIIKYLSRLEDIVEIKLDDEKDPGVSLTDDFPTDQLEASSLLSEVGATHLLTIAPATLPSSLIPPLGALRARRPSGLVSPFFSPAPGTMTPPDSTSPSPLSSRSSSFSNTSRLSSPATSILSLLSLLPPSKLRLEVSSSDSDEESENELETMTEPDYLTLAGVEYHHITIKDSDQSGLLLRLNEAVCFIQHALDEDGSESEQDLNPGIRNNDRRKHVLIHCSIESRACAVAFLEKALPLFNPTKSFVTLLELFHDCDFNPTLDHPRFQAWLSGSSKPRISPSKLSSSISDDTNGVTKPNHHPTAAQWKESDIECEDSVCLHYKLATPMRSGSFSNAYMQQLSNERSSRRPPVANGSTSRPAGSTDGLDIGALLQRFQGVGDPDFTFDVEAFRGALHGIVADTEKKMGRSRTAS
ncbi:phosphatases II [Sanghuangporus baumii]|uniref:protein-tyrosine-phosphatase n=1 Tax=Sanghuangporus baumii TaxID=108892 RepID=A0A9Q5HWS1_SANBA|nr:phosphatases II [Sanghuangporus baumii]